MVHNHQRQDAAPTGFQVVAGCRKFPFVWESTVDQEEHSWVSIPEVSCLPGRYVELYFADHTSAYSNPQSRPGSLGT